LSFFLSFCAFVHFPYFTRKHFRHHYVGVSVPLNKFRIKWQNSIYLNWCKETFDILYLNSLKSTILT
jgi:hypothetical protein